MSLKSSEVAEGLGVATQVCVMLQHGRLDVRSRAAESSCIHCEMMALSREDGGHRPGDSSAGSLCLSQEQVDSEFTSLRAASPRQVFKPRKFDVMCRPPPPTRNHMHTHVCALEGCLSFGTS